MKSSPLPAACKIIRGLKLRDDVKPDVARAILSEWLGGQSDLVRAEAEEASYGDIRKRLTLIAKHGPILLAALRGLDERGKFELGRAWVPETHHGELNDAAHALTAGDKAVETAISALSDLARAAPEAVKAAPKGRPLKRARALALYDLAAIYEWLTGKEASRSTRGYKDKDLALGRYGKHYGDFYSFAEACWRAAHGDDEGLSEAMKRWAETKARSGWLETMAALHPEWGIVVKA